MVIEDSRPIYTRLLSTHRIVAMLENGIQYRIQSHLAPSTVRLFALSGPKKLHLRMQSEQRWSHQRFTCPNIMTSARFWRSSRCLGRDKAVPSHLVMTGVVSELEGSESQGIDSQRKKKRALELPSR